MDNPVTIVKGAATSAINPRNIIYGIMAFLVIAALADLLGVTTWLLSPVSKFKAWNAARNTAA